MLAPDDDSDVGHRRTPFLVVARQGGLLHAVGRLMHTVEKYRRVAAKQAVDRQLRRRGRGRHRPGRPSGRPVMGYFFGLGAVITLLAAFAAGRMAVRISGGASSPSRISDTDIKYK